MRLITQSAILDIVFNFDSELSDVGIADHLPVMIAAVVIAVLVMVGVALVADGLHHHFKRSIIYAAMAFSGAVKALYLWQTKRANRHVPPTDSP